MPKLSIIIPVYNKAIYLNALFSEMLKQSFVDFECILIDDGSTDESAKLCDCIAERDNRFRAFHIPNGGVSHARNVGISKAEGDYITFIDADDEIPSNYLERLYCGITCHNADICICSITKVWDIEKKQEILLPKVGLCNINDLLDRFAENQAATGIYGYCPGKVFSTSLLGDIRFDENIRLAEDFDFYLKLYSVAGKIFFEDKTTYFYLQGTVGSTGIVSDYAVDYRTQLTIMLRYRKFLQDNGAFTGQNQKIVSAKLSDYVFFSLFYCEKKNLKECLRELYVVCKRENIILRGRNGFAGICLWLLKCNRLKMLEIILGFYHHMRKLLRG